MPKLRIVLLNIVGIVAALWLGGAGMMGYSNFGMEPRMMSGIITAIVPTYLALIIGAGVVLILLLLATNRNTQWQ